MIFMIYCKLFVPSVSITFICDLQQRDQNELEIPIWRITQWITVLNYSARLRCCPQQAKQEKQQQRKEKTRSKGPSEPGREKSSQRHRPDHNASSGAEGDVSSEREA